MFRKLWKRLFSPADPREVVFVNYAEGDRLLRKGEGWRIAPEEDKNRIQGMVWLERPYKVA